jgi:hypothetical protein
MVDLMEALRRSVGGAAAETSAPKKAGKKPRKAAAGQKEMLMPIDGKNPAKRLGREEVCWQAATGVGLSRETCNRFARSMSRASY